MDVSVEIVLQLLGEEVVKNRLLANEIDLLKASLPAESSAPVGEESHAAD